MLSIYKMGNECPLPVPHSIKELIIGISSIVPEDYNLTFSEKRDMVRRLNDVISNINKEPATDKKCANCQFFTNGRCAARGLADIPLPVQNKEGGCSLYQELDYVPF